MRGQSRPKFHQVDRVRMSLTCAKIGRLGKTSLLTLQSKRGNQFPVKMSQGRLNRYNRKI